MPGKTEPGPVDPVFGPQLACRLHPFDADFFGIERDGPDGPAGGTGRRNICGNCASGACVLCVGDSCECPHPGLKREGA